MKNIFRLILISLLVLLPAVSFAQSAGGDSCDAFRGFTFAICRVTSLLNSLLPLLLALGVVYFVWGVVQYVIGGSDEDKKKGREQILYGIIGFVVILSIWGLVFIVQNTFGINSSSAPTAAQLNTLVVQQGDSSSCNFSGPNKKFQDLLKYITCIIGNSIIPFIFAGAVLFFMWGVLKFIMNASNDEKRKEGREFMIWGIIALAVMISVWGLVKIVTTTFDLGDTNYVPQVRPVKTSQ